MMRTIGRWALGLSALVALCGASACRSVVEPLPVVCADTTLVGSSTLPCFRILNGAGHSESQRLACATARWASLHLTDYTLTYQRNCFCPSLATMRVDITVRGGRVREVQPSKVDPEPNPPSLSDAEKARFFTVTVDSLFALLAVAAGGGADSVAVTYDSCSGAPRAIFIDYYRDAVDDEVWYTARVTR